MIMITTVDGVMGQRQQPVLWRDTKWDAAEDNVVAEVTEDKTAKH